MHECWRYKRAKDNVCNKTQTGGQLATGRLLLSLSSDGETSTEKRVKSTYFVFRTELCQVLFSIHRRERVDTQPPMQRTALVHKSVAQFHQNSQLFPRLTPLTPGGKKSLPFKTHSADDDAVVKVKASSSNRRKKKRHAVVILISSDGLHVRPP